MTEPNEQVNWDALRDAMGDPELTMASILAIVLFLDMVIPNAEQAITEMVTAISASMKEANDADNENPTE